MNELKIAKPMNELKIAKPMNELKIAKPMNELKIAKPMNELKFDKYMFLFLVLFLLVLDRMRHVIKFTQFYESSL